MKIVNILGGLGNQMFEYAMLASLRYEHPEESVMWCTRSFHGYRFHNGFEIQRVFGIHETEASLSQLSRVAYPFFNYRTWQIMRHCLPARKTMVRGAFDIPFDYSQVTRTDSVFYDGYWQNERNFRKIREQILLDFSFPEFHDKKNKELEIEIVEEMSVSCHVRRGDYLKEPRMCVCTPEYYSSAIKEMDKRVSPTLYCIISDDISWCREKIGPMLGGKKVVYVDWNKGQNSYRDMQIMSLCKHSIIANSSFSWWGAWLGTFRDRIVIAPHKWTRGKVLNDPICEGWIRMEG